MKGQQTYSSLSSMKVENMTVKELKAYIREVALRVGRNTTSSMKAVASHAKMIVRDFGTYRRNRQTYMKLGLSHARKAELIEKAQKLRSFAKTYSTNKEERKARNERARKAHETFNEKHKKEYGEIPFDEWETFFEASRELKNYFSKYGSTMVNLYMEYRKKGVSPKRFVDIIFEAERELRKEEIVLDIESVVDRASKLLEKYFG